MIDPSYLVLPRPTFSIGGTGFFACKTSVSYLVPLFVPRVHVCAGVCARIRLMDICMTCRDVGQDVVFKNEKDVPPLTLVANSFSLLVTGVLTAAV